MTDFKGFTQVVSRLSPAALLRELDFYSSEFDRIIEAGRIKNRGEVDMYFVVGPRYDARRSP